MKLLPDPVRNFKMDQQSGRRPAILDVRNGNLFSETSANAVGALDQRKIKLMSENPE